MLAYGINDVLFKHVAQQGGPPHQMMMVMTSLMTIALIVYAIANKAAVASTPALWGALAGPASLLAMYSFARSLKVGAVSMAAPIFRLAFVVTSVLAILLLGETLSLTKAAGFALAATAIWFLLTSGRGQSFAVPREALLWVLVATGSLGLAFFLFKLALLSGASAATVLLYQALTATSLAIVVSRIIDRRFLIAEPIRKFGIPIAAIQTVGFISLVEALSRGEATVVTPVSQLSFVVAAVLGVAFLKERLTARKCAGLSAAVGAVALLGMAAASDGAPMGGQ